MLLLLFEIAGQRYGLDAGRVLEVSTLPLLRAIPGAPKAVAGTFNYRGAMAPVVDLSVALAGRPCPPLLSTRLILVDYPGPDGQNHPLGLMAERVTETLSVAPGALVSPGVASETAPFLGAMVLTEGGGSIQTLDLDKVLPEDLRSRLFPRMGDAQAGTA